MVPAGEEGRVVTIIYLIMMVPTITQIFCLLCTSAAAKYLVTGHYFESRLAPFFSNLERGKNITIIITINTISILIDRVHGKEAKFD